MLSSTGARRAPDRLTFAVVAVAAIACTVIWVSEALADPPTQDWVRTETRADCDDYSALRNPYFGDLHVHTKYSADAVLARIRSDPRDAYEFAKGESAVDLPPYDGMDVALRTATIDRPLDFTAVTDHAEGFGEARICLNPGYAGYNDTVCSDLRDTFDVVYEPAPQLPDAFLTFFLPLTQPAPARFSLCGPGNADCTAEAALVWNDTQDAAEEHYDRTSACSFTTFVAYEWSGQRNASNLHRNVIFRNADVPATATSYYEEDTAEGLWGALDAQCLQVAGDCDVLAIPHNSNISKGDMFTDRTGDDIPYDAAGAAFRAGMEPLVEIMQDKGDSECRNGVGGTADELCNFEKGSRLTLVGGSDWNQSFHPRSYVRGALRYGLSIERRLGVNPFHFGVIGSTDTHNSMPGGVDEERFATDGHHGIADSEPRYILSKHPPAHIESNGGGLAVIWAEENSRDALFAAMRRKETYSTSGTRPIVRMFAGRFPRTLCDDPEFVAEGYDKGVPMGGDLGPIRGRRSPRIAVLAHKDTGGPATPLQRIQIVKGWIDSKGVTKEAVYEVAGDPESGASVDLETCTPTGTGFESLCAVWEDPKFDATQNAFYYARVVENPVCRWSQRLCNDVGVDCSMPESVPEQYEMCCDEHTQPTIQERAVTSSVWYHSERVGLDKAKIKFGSVAGADRLQMNLLVPSAEDVFDPETDDLALAIRDDAVAYSVTVPAGTMAVKKTGAKYLLKDKTGAIGGITTMLLKISKKGTAQIKLKTGNVDLSTIDRDAQALSVDLESGDFSSSTTRDFGYKAPQLRLVL